MCRGLTSTTMKQTREGLDRQGKDRVQERLRNTHQMSCSRYSRVIVLCLMVAACLPADPGTDLENELSAAAIAKQTTTAPLFLPDDILEARSFKQSSSLDPQVESGELPPLSERLPDRPLVVVPMDEIGWYGGTLRRALTGDIVQTPGVSKTLGENLMGYERPLPKQILFNLADSLWYEDEGHAAVFRLRAGVKWSDGVPFTVDDILFWYEDMMLDSDARASAAFSSFHVVDGEPLVAEKIDDLTIRFRGRKPLGRIQQAFATDLGAMPKHYFAKFHPRYNPKMTYEACRDSTSNAMRLYRPGTPVLSAWMPVEWERGQRIVYARNPYYWKVDTAGNQLPYADRLIFNVIQDTQVILLKFINGEIDFLGRYAQINMFPTLRAEERKGKIKLRLGTPAMVSQFRLNWDTPRPELREAIRNLNVRRALSYAINREEISEILYHGLLVPASHSFGPASAFFSEADAKRHAMFDPEKSRQLLDEAGYVDSDGDGVRELRDGSPFTATMDVIPGIGVDICQLAVDYWKAVGIEIHMNVALRDIAFPKWANGEFEFFWWYAWSEDPVVRPMDWGIIGETRPTWHRNASKEGPEWLRESTRLILETQTTLDEGKLAANMARVRELHTEQVPMLIAGYASMVWGHSTRLGNVPVENTSSDGYRGWSRPLFHEQIYVKEGGGAN